MKSLVSLNRYEIIKNVGREYQPHIKLVEDRETHIIFVAKTIELSCNQGKTDLNSGFQIMGKLHHPTINNMIGFSYNNFFGDDYLTLILEYVSNGNLKEFLELKEIDDTIRQIINTGISRSILFLNENNLSHNDINSHKILIDDKIHPHLSITTFIEQKEYVQIFALKVLILL